MPLRLSPVDRPPEPLTPIEHRLLVDIVGRESPELLPLARDAVNMRWLTDEECESLKSVVLGALSTTLAPTMSRTNRVPRLMTCSAGSRCKGHATGVPKSAAFA